MRESRLPSADFSLDVDDPTEIELKSIITNTNVNVLREYDSYLVRGWEEHYLSYDYFKEISKQLRETNKSEMLETLYKSFLLDVTRLHEFIVLIIDECENNLEQLKTEWKTLDEPERYKATHDHESRPFERALRVLYEKSKLLIKFYKLNQYLVFKLFKKVDKILATSVKHNMVESHLDTVTQLHEAKESFELNETIVMSCNASVMDFYAHCYRKSYSVLTYGELEYVKYGGKSVANKRLFFGLKIGFNLSLVAYIFFDSNFGNAPGQTNNFFENPGLYIYTSIGMIVLFQLMWSVNVWAWAEHDIDYISIFHMHNIKPNTLQIMDENASLMLIFSVNLFLYYNANSTGSVFHSEVFLIGCPFFLILSTLAFYVYQSFRHGNNHLSSGLFSKAVLYRCIIAPAVPVQFRDAFAGDVLTSFTAFISNSIYATCWVVSSSFLRKDIDDDANFNYRNFGSGYMQCTGATMTLVVDSFVLIPLWIRFAQCWRAYYDTGLSFPHVFNALKYFFAILAVVYAMIGGTSSTVYYVLVVVASSYKAWWDVVIDMNLCVILPTFTNCFPRNVLLREKLMYSETWAYYMAIPLDFILRFAWVASLTPSSFLFNFVGPTLTVCLGMFEIMRRSMWSHFRVEVEHMKFLDKHQLGFIDSTKHKDYQSIESKKAIALRARQTTKAKREAAAPKGNHYESLEKLDLLSKRIATEQELLPLIINESGSVEISTVIENTAEISKSKKVGGAACCK